MALDRSAQRYSFAASMSTQRVVQRLDRHLRRIFHVNCRYRLGRSWIVLAEENGSWTRAFAVDEVRAGEGKALAVDPPVAVWNVEGEFLATDDTCTHERFSLSEGYVDGCQVECAWHWAKFDLRTGAALSLPAFESLRTYPVSIHDGAVFVDLSSRG